MSSPATISTISKSRGVVLPTVLWITILIIVVTINYASDVHINTKAADNIKAAMMLKYDASSGIYIALDRLLSNPSNDNLSYQLSINKNNVAIEVRPENIKTDLNTASANQLRSAFRDVGMNEEMADTMSDRVIDWRDADHSSRLYGMEDAEYFSKGNKYGAKDGRFEDLVELLLLADIDKNLFQRIPEFFTIYSKASGKLYTLTSRASSNSEDKSYVINTVVKLTYQAGKPYRVLKWQYNNS